MNEYPQGYPHDEPTLAPQTGSGQPHPQEYAMSPMTPQRPPRRTRRGWWIAGGAALALALLVGVGVVAGPAFAAAGGQRQSPALSLLNGDKGGAHPGMGGRFGQGHGELTVQKVSGGTITATRPDGKSVTIHTTSSTTYWRAGSQVNAGAVTTGAHIAVKGQRGSDGSVTATRVEIVLPSYAGKVTAINGSDVTVQGRDGKSHTIHTSSSTKVKRAGTDASLGDIKVGDSIAASGTLNSDQTLTAETIRVALPAAGGQVTAISGADVTVRDRQGGTLTIHTGASTKFYTVSRGQNGPQKTQIALGDLKSGDRILAEGTRNSDGSLNALVVTVVPQGAFGGPKQPGQQPGQQPSQTQPGAAAQSFPEQDATLLVTF